MITVLINRFELLLHSNITISISLQISQQNYQNIVLAIDEKPKLGQGILLSIQHLFAMFGATVLVPALTGMSPAIALISSGIGTLVFILITRGKVPSYLGFL